MDTFRLYARSMAIQIKSQLQYPLSFLLQTLAQLVMVSGELMAVILLVNRFDHVNQWGAGDLYFFFGLMSVAFYLTEIFGRGITGAFPSMVRNGQLDTILLRPRGVLTQVLCSAADPRRITCIAVGVVSLVMGSGISAIAWTPMKALLLAESIFFSFWLLLGLFMVEGILCIHSVKSVELANTLTYGGRSACEYPSDIYPRPLRILFTVVAPFALVMHVPASFILDKPLFGWPMWTAFLTPLAGLALFGVMYVLFRKALKFYRSTGN